MLSPCLPTRRGVKNISSQAVAGCAVALAKVPAGLVNAHSRSFGCCLPKRRAEYDIHLCTVGLKMAKSIGWSDFKISPRLAISGVAPL